ncbi:hypothetical protein AJ87_05090 [Rhizobium yanglingense]|nr:hypothetical protein AJ87_05090 [Rhizobium yanglingense]
MAVVQAAFGPLLSVSRASTLVESGHSFSLACGMPALYGQQAIGGVQEDRRLSRSSLGQRFL